jgi:hypothetical protein
MQFESVCFLNWLFSGVGKSFSAAGHDKGHEATGTHSANCAELFGV